MLLQSLQLLPTLSNDRQNMFFATIYGNPEWDPEKETDYVSKDWWCPARKHHNTITEPQSKTLKRIKKILIVVQGLANPDL
jgi:hypothetical protein